ncbi:CBS domain-containing protein [Streptomyces sp. NPDC004749]
MTPVQTQQHQVEAAPAAVADDMDASGPRVCDDMTVEVALSIMASARVTYLLLCDGDDQCTGVVTRAQLTLLRESSTYTDRIRLRDVLGARFTSPGTRTLTLEERGRALGVLALCR